MTHGEMKREFKKYLLPASAFLDNGTVRYHDGRITDIVNHLAAIEVDTLRLCNILPALH